MHADRYYGMDLEMEQGPVFDVANSVPPRLHHYPQLSLPPPIPPIPSRVLLHPPIVLLALPLNLPPLPPQSQSLEHLNFHRPADETCLPSRAQMQPQIRSNLLILSSAVFGVLVWERWMNYIHSSLSGDATEDRKHSLETLVLEFKQDCGIPRPHLRDFQLPCQHYLFWGKNNSLRWGIYWLGLSRYIGLQSCCLATSVNTKNKCLQSP